MSPLDAYGSNERVDQIGNLFKANIQEKEIKKTKKLMSKCQSMSSLDLFGSRRQFNPAMMKNLNAVSQNTAGKFTGS
jgi:hypothetical protein